ncbi:MAG: ROK family protein [Chloroflexota bacterium]
MARFLGVDLGGTNIKWVVLEHDGEQAFGQPLATGSSPTGAAEGPDGVTGRVVAVVRDAMARHAPIAAAGVGVPGLFGRDTGLIELFPNLPGPWAGYPLRDRVAASAGIPVTLVNDARAFTLAEGLAGAGRGARTVACLTLGTGVGGGIMIDGRLHLGANGRAGEIGHQTVLADGPRCGCGNPGCVESLTQARALTTLAGRERVEDVYAGLAAGDAACVAAIESVTDWLAIGIANVVTVLVPDRVVIGGGIASAGEGLLARLCGAVRRRTPRGDPENIVIVAAELGSSAGAIGAALAAATARDEAIAMT